MPFTALCYHLCHLATDHICDRWVWDDPYGYKVENGVRVQEWKLGNQRWGFCKSTGKNGGGLG